MSSEVKEKLLRPIKNLIKKRFVDWSLRSDGLGRVQMADLAVRFTKLNQVVGSYLEFGVYKGASFSSLYHAFRRYDLSVPMFAFDGFEGLPMPKKEDRMPGSEQFRAGEFRVSQEDFVREVKIRGVPPSAYKIVPGLFNQSLKPDLYTRLGLIKAAIIWIDCDLYESTKPVLEFCAPLLQNGTVLIFDDFYCFKGNPDYGERRALDEFLSEHPEVKVTDYAKFSSVGQAFIASVSE